MPFKFVANARFVGTCCLLVATIGFSLILVRPALAAENEPSLTPCLAMDAAGGPIYPTSTFLPAGKELCAVFALGPEETFSKLTSRWTVVEAGEAAPPNTKLAENELELNGKKSGTLWE
jgi:hypothetical protein